MGPSSAIDWRVPIQAQSCGAHRPGKRVHPTKLHHGAFCALFTCPGPTLGRPDGFYIFMIQWFEP